MSPRAAVSGNSPIHLKGKVFERRMFLLVKYPSIIYQMYFFLCKYQSVFRQNLFYEYLFSIIAERCRENAIKKECIDTLYMYMHTHTHTHTHT